MEMECRVSPSGVRGSLRIRLPLESGRSVLASEGNPLPILGGFILWAFAVYTSRLPGRCVGGGVAWGAQNAGISTYSIS